jgi:hypothetical protein
LEFQQRQGRSYEVVMQNYDREWVTASDVEALLPYSFTKRNPGQLE